MTDVQELIKRLRTTPSHQLSYDDTQAAADALQQQAAEIEGLKSQMADQGPYINKLRDKVATYKAKLDEAQNQEPVNQSLAEDIESIDTHHRGDPFYEHDAYWMRKAAADAVRKGYALYTRPIPAADVNAGLVEALEAAKRWHQGDKWRDGDSTERAAWEDHLAVINTALSSAQAAPARVVADRLNRPEIVSYVARYGGMCRDCADENGICPNSGLACASNKGIEHVLSALDYGLKHGYIAAAPQRKGGAA